MYKNIITYVLLLAPLNIFGQLFYRVSFKDKQNTPYLLSNPSDYLSDRAIERREVQNIAIDSLDLPVDPEYIYKVLKQGADLVHTSKWFNSITVKTDSNNFRELVLSLPFVTDVELTKRSNSLKSYNSKFVAISTSDFNLSANNSINLYVDTAMYGISSAQIGQINLHYLHSLGFRGKGLQIGILDAGFYNVDQYISFDSLWMNNRILGVKDFVSKPEENIFKSHYHGMSVLSIMGCNIRGRLIGSAPDASYWLIRTDDAFSEYIIEEDNWIAGAEFADSVGVDIINSSLGYSLFNDVSMNHCYEELDGNTIRVTIGANIASSRGILVVSSAGNEGRETNSWRYIIAPSDGDSVLSVGAVSKNGIVAPFSSHGPSSDGDVKPNIVALGWGAAAMRSNGKIDLVSGTSYSTPLIAGASACLWQANPGAKAWQIKDAIERSSNFYFNPDTLSGYGIPDILLADRMLKIPGMSLTRNSSKWIVYPNPAKDYIILLKQDDVSIEDVKLSFFTIDGRLLRSIERSDASKIIVEEIGSLPNGLLILQIITGGSQEYLKIRKYR